MKTPIQKLIEKLKRNIEEMPNKKNIFTQGYKAGLSFVIGCAANSLEKEKEQIMNLIRFVRLNDKMGKSTHNIYDEFFENNVKSKICEYCANEFIPKSPKLYDIKKYCTMDCREKEYYRRAKVKRELKKFFNNENI